MKDGFIKVAAASPRIRLADPMSNAAACIGAAELACGEGVKVLVFPELALTGCSCGDLFLNETLLEGALSAFAETDGRSVSEDVVAGIFSKFCVGK